MAEFPAMPLLTDAYIADTQHLSNEEHGCYLRLLIISWRTPDCSLPDDDKRLATMLGLTPKRWREKIKPSIAPFWTISDGVWTQKKQLKVRKKVENWVQQKRDAYSKTERAKRLKDKERGLSDDQSGDPSGDQSLEESTKTKRKESESRVITTSLTPGGSDPNPAKPNPEKFLMTKAWTMATDVETRLTAEHVPKLGADGFWRQVGRFIEHHVKLGKPDSQEGFELSLTNWIDHADDNRDPPPKVNGSGHANGTSPTPNGTGPPTGGDVLPGMDGGKFQKLVLHEYRRAKDLKFMTNREEFDIKAQALAMKVGKADRIGLERVGYWAKAEVLQRLGMNEIRASS